LASILTVLSRLVLVNEITGEKASSPVNGVEKLKPDDEYDLVIVLIRKNRLIPVYEILAARPGVKNVDIGANAEHGCAEELHHLKEAGSSGGCSRRPGGRRGARRHETSGYETLRCMK
jgi:hypothetical protein